MASALDSCLAKMQRAGELLTELTTEVRAFESAATAALQVSRGLAFNRMSYSLTAQLDKEVPIRVAVRAGEVVHQIRSSLDHLVSGLVELHGGTVTRQHQFPICGERSLFERAIARGQLQFLPPAVCCAIESVQPFTSSTPQDTVLAALGDLDNQDKHRALSLVAALGVIESTVTLGKPGALSMDGSQVTIVGFDDALPRHLGPVARPVFTVQFSKPVDDFYVDARFAVHLAYATCGLARNVDLVQTSAGLLQGVRHTIELVLKSADVPATPEA